MFHWTVLPVVAAALLFAAAGKAVPIPGRLRGQGALLLRGRPVPDRPQGGLPAEGVPHPREPRDSQPDVRVWLQGVSNFRLVYPSCWVCVCACVFFGFRWLYRVLV